MKLKIQYLAPSYCKCEKTQKNQSTKQQQQQTKRKQTNLKKTMTITKNKQKKQINEPKKNEQTITTIKSQAINFGSRTCS